MIQALSDLEFSTRSRLRKVMITVLLAFLIFMTYFLTFGYLHSLAEAEKASLMRLNGIVYTLAMQIDGDAHERLMARHQAMDALQNNTDDPDYHALHLVLRQNAMANMLNTPIYTIIPNGDKGFCFGVSSAEKPYFRHPYHSAPALLLEKYAEGGMIPRYKDEFGTWLSAFAAVRNKQGRMVALVQADQKFDEFLMQARAELWRNLAIGLTVGIIFLFILVQVLRPILKKEEKTQEALAHAYQNNQRMNERLQQNLEQLSNLDSFRREMVANLSHDLRTPLSAVLGYLETILEKKDELSPEEQKRFLHIALAEAKRLNRLIADLFDLSNLESGQIKINPEPFNIAELAQDTLHKYQLQAETKQIKFLTNFAENLPLVCADLRWTDRVLQNLMDNALRYAPEGGFVMFTIFEEANSMHFKVCNSGDPIPQAHLDQVFERYFKSTNRKKDSTGLGLTIVKKIVELHGQRVWAESNENLTTFRFTLPVLAR